MTCDLDVLNLVALFMLYMVTRLPLSSYHIISFFPDPPSCPVSFLMHTTLFHPSLYLSLIPPPSFPPPVALPDTKLDRKDQLCVVNEVRLVNHFVTHLTSGQKCFILCSVVF